MYLDRVLLVSNQFLKPGERYTYTSGCELKSELGIMKGFYTFKNLIRRRIFSSICTYFQNGASRKVELNQRLLLRQEQLTSKIIVKAPIIQRKRFDDASSGSAFFCIFTSLITFSAYVIISSSAVFFSSK